MLASLVVAVVCAAPSEPAPHPFGIADMLAMQRIGEAQLAPDGKWIAFTLRTTDIEANRGRTDVWVVSVDGKTTRQLTTHPEGDWAPEWTPDGRGIYFLSTRSGGAQVWQIALAGGEARQVTHFPLDVNTATPVGDGRHLVVTMDVYPDAATLDETAKRDEAKAASKVKALAFDELLFRHWDDWEDGKRSHVFVWSIPVEGEAAAQPIDLMKGMAMDAPERPFGGSEGVAVAPDGRTVAFVGRNAGRDAAWSTNLDVWLVPIDGSAAPVALTAANPGADSSPVFSPDGKTLAVLSQARAGYESDRQRVVLYDLATRGARVLAEAWDRSASELAWTVDGKGLVTSADHLGNHAIFHLDAKSGAATLVVGKGTNSGVQVGRDVVVFQHDDLRSPVELMAFDVKHLRGAKEAPAGAVRAVTRVNASRVASVAWSKYEQFTFAGAKGDTVHGYVVWPHGYTEGAKVPVALVIHGGPQGSMGDHFHYRWNPMALAGRGFAVVFIDFHGSTGYGQAFTDSIRGDWGGAPFEDLMKGLDYALAHYPFMDGARSVALGASYGGYMINWVNGHTNRFKALVCHDGNLDETMAYYDTEELWFPEWDQGGTPWEIPEKYRAQSPMTFVDKWQTPTLVIHGAKDFRVVETQGMGTFTALQRRGIPSRFLYFPDENHWVLKPQNSQRWHAEVFAWLDRWTR